MNDLGGVNLGSGIGHIAALVEPCAGQVEASGRLYIGRGAALLVLDENGRSRSGRGGLPVVGQKLADAADRVNHVRRIPSQGPTEHDIEVGCFLSPEARQGLLRAGTRLL